MIDGVEGGLPKRRRWPFWVSLGLVMVLLFCVAPVALVATLISRMPDIPARSDSPTNDAQTPAQSPQPGDPAKVTAAWIGDRMSELLDRQAKALLRGDEAGFLAVADPAAPATGDLKRQFKALRAMQVTAWQPEMRDDPVRLESTGEWRALVTVKHCFVVPTCEIGPVVIGTRWREAAGQPRLVAVEPSLSGADGPRPWEVSDLVVAIGARTLIATTVKFRDRLPKLLKQAERAAAVADRFALRDSPPDRYRIFYAGSEEWKLWYGGSRPAWTAGYAIAVGGNHYEMVLNADGLANSRLDDLLRHEMAHAASLPGRGYANAGSWWLVEGLAEYVAVGNQPVSRYDSLAEVGQLLKAGSWNGRLEKIEPADDAADWEVAGSYGVGYLAVRHLADRFGEQPMLDFFRAVLHGDQSAAKAAQEAFGEDWSVLHDDCVAYLRGVAS